LLFHISLLFSSSSPCSIFCFRIWVEVMIAYPVIQVGLCLFHRSQSLCPVIHLSIDRSIYLSSNIKESNNLPKNQTLLFSFFSSFSF
jgi:hypothetical protein